MEKRTKEELFDMFYKNNCEFPLECVEVLLMNGYFISHDLYWNVIMEYCKAIPLSKNYTLEEVKAIALGAERVNRGREQDFFKSLQERASVFRSLKILNFIKKPFMLSPQKHYNKKLRKEKL